MKKLAIWFLTIFLLMTAGACAEEPLLYHGGATMEEAADISPAQYGQVLLMESNDTWYRLQVPEDGVYTFRTKIKSKTYGNTHAMNILDKDGEFVANIYELYSDVWKSVEFTAKKNEVYYLRFYVARAEFYFTICMNDYHQAGVLEKELRPATCTEGGEIGILCDLCGGVAKTKTTPALGHKAGAEEILTPASCLSSGLKGEKCTICGDVVTSEAIPMTDHVPGMWEELKPATCTTDGIRKQYCTICNATLGSETVPALGHMPNIRETFATCLVAGKKETICATCGEILSIEEGALAAHISGTWIDLNPATCTADGVRVQRCTVCNATITTETVAAFGHRPMAWVVAQEGSCLVAGQRVQKCSDCGVALAEEEIAATGHAWTEWVTDLEATKTYEGSMSRFCTHCGEQQTQTIPKVEKFMGIF